jgi:predicted dehydrogenase/threonine dehydrogenase-like Zn-dependent dehydrogenase
MKQVSQRMGDGSLDVVEVAPPVLTPDTVLVSLRASLLSAGTERAKVRTARQSLIGKARSRPDQVAKVLEAARRDGLAETIRTVRSRLNAPGGLGYSAAGVVLEVGSRVTDISPGDQVACGGATAMHAEVDRVPGNLCVKMPAGLTFESAAFATLGSIAMHGVRQADVRLGERVAVIGLGLVGQLTGQILRAAGCRVVGIDLDQVLVDHAVEHGAADAAFRRQELDGGTLPPEASGCDAVIITAATSSPDPIRLAADLARDRGRVVVVGDVGMEIPRAPYYEKELDLRLSRSYGPGRYDTEYEERGLDYPIGYVRWTERRNMSAFLELVASGRVDVSSLVTGRLDIDDAADAYERLAESDASPLAIILAYPPREGAPTVRSGERTPREAAGEGRSRMRSAGVIGAGSFAERIMVPGLASAGFELSSIASASGLSADHVAGRFGFARSVSPPEVLGDPDIDVVAIATRHSTHAELALDALRAGKAVFVEKPPALDFDELDRLDAAVADGPPLVVGFNRRHAPQAVALREHVVRGDGPATLVYRVNAGRLPDDHWTNDVHEGGGRLVGEGCHFVDFACWFAGTLPRRVSCLVRPEPGRPLRTSQSFTLALEFPNGSLATIVYEAGGAPGLAKEYVEAHAGGRSGALDDFKTLTLYEGRRGRRNRSAARGKGHKEQFAALPRTLAGELGAARPSHLETMRVTLAAARSAETGQTLNAAGSELG